MAAWIMTEAKFLLPDLNTNRKTLFDRSAASFAEGYTSWK